MTTPPTPSALGQPQATGPRLARKTALLVALTLGSGWAGAQTLTYTPSSPQAAPDVVPAGVGAIKVTVLGGAGGSGSYDEKTAGNGAPGTQVAAVIRVQPGQSITVVAGAGGKGGTTYGVPLVPKPERGGLGGSGDGAGGRGATVGLGGESGGGGGGGGASSLTIGNTWVRAGGGGGGGGDSYLSGNVVSAAVAAQFTADAPACATPAPGAVGVPHPNATDDGGGGGGGGGGYQGAAGAGGSYGLDGNNGNRIAESGGMGGSCTLSTAPNTISSPVASVPGAPTLFTWTDPSASGVDGSVTIEYVFQPIVTLACDKTALTDSANQQAVCTVTLSEPAPAAGLSVPFTLSAANPQYSTQSCASPVLIAAGQTQAPACTIVAANNRVAGEAPVTVALQIEGGNDYLTGTPDQASILITNDNIDERTPPTPPPPAVAQPVPTLGAWGSLVLTALLGLLAFMRRKTLAGMR